MSYATLIFYLKDKMLILLAKLGSKNTEKASVFRNEFLEKRQKDFICLKKE